MNLVRTFEIAVASILMISCAASKEDVYKLDAKLNSIQSHDLEEGISKSTDHDLPNALCIYNMGTINDLKDNSTRLDKITDSSQCPGRSSASRVPLKEGEDDNEREYVCEYMTAMAKAESICEGTAGYRFAEGVREEVVSKVRVMFQDSLPEDKWSYSDGRSFGCYLPCRFLK